MTMFMVLSSWQSHCESSPGIFDECRMAQSNGPLYSNKLIGTLHDDRWATTFGTARSLGGLRSHPGPSLLYQI